MSLYSLDALERINLFSISFFRGYVFYAYIQCCYLACKCLIGYKIGSTRKVVFPKFKKKSASSGSFYIGCDQVVIINKGQEIASIDEELTQDVQEFITVLSSRLYGLNSKKNQKLIDNLSKAVIDNKSNLPQD